MHLLSLEAKRQPRPYSLYRRRRGSRQWERVEGTGQYTKPTAVRVFQSYLLAYAFDKVWQVELRPVR
jgi:hypothetical protein